MTNEHLLAKYNRTQCIHSQALHTKHHRCTGQFI